MCSSFLVPAQQAQERCCESYSVTMRAVERGFFRSDRSSPGVGGQHQSRARKMVENRDSLCAGQGGGGGLHRCRQSRARDRDCAELRCSWALMSALTKARLRSVLDFTIPRIPGRTEQLS